MLIIGDVSKDGRINIDDLLIVQGYLQGKFTLTAEEAQRADTNGDGEVDIRDLANINLHHLGIAMLDEVIY